MIVAKGARITFYSPKTHVTGDNEAEPNIDSMGKFRMTSLQRDYTGHYEALHAVHKVITAWGLDYHVAVAEIALDSDNEREAKDLSITMKLKYANPLKTFNYSNGEHEKGGSDNGQDEYVNYRKSRRRQKHTYYKRGWKVWRNELTFRRDYLKKAKLPGRRGISTIPELFEHMRQLVEGAVSFVKLDAEKLRKDAPYLRIDGLETRTPNEALRILGRELNCAPKTLQKYFKPAAKPAINYTPVFPIPSESLSFPDVLDKMEGEEI